MSIIYECNVVEAKYETNQRLTIKFQLKPNTHFAALGSSVLWMCRFDSCHPHLLIHKDLEQIAPSPFFMGRARNSKLVIALDCRWFCVDSFGDVADLIFRQFNKGPTNMASLQKLPAGTYHISIPFGGKRYKRSLKRRTSRPR